VFDKMQQLEVGLASTTHIYTDSDCSSTESYLWKLSNLGLTRAEYFISVSKSGLTVAQYAFMSHDIALK